MLVLDNIRSAYNVGSLMRTADGLGLKSVYTCGLTPHPRQTNDSRLPHVIASDEHKLAKTALGAEQTLDIQHFANIDTVIKALKAQNYVIVALEQAADALELRNWRQPKQPVALILGHERRGVSNQALAVSDMAVQITMRGHKKSFNVAAAGAMAMYELTR